MDGFRRRPGSERSLGFRHFLVVCYIWHLAVVVLAQKSPTSSPAAPTPKEAAAEESCVGVFLTYRLTSGPTKMPPFASNVSNQAYKFESTVILTNYGYMELQNWELAIDFQYREVIAAAPGVLFLDGQTTPGVNTSTSNQTVIVGLTSSNLLTTIETADDLTKIATSVLLTGTEFGMNQSQFPLPAGMKLVNDGYTCNVNTSAPKGELWVCCAENSTATSGSNPHDGNFAPRGSGDIIMTYDVTSASTGTYIALVSIVMNDPIVRMDNWNVTWQWENGEFISTMEGGQVAGTNQQDLCIYGSAAEQYTSLDFSTVMSCSPTPTIIDLEPWALTVPTLAIPHCCRNGTLLPDLIDPAQSRSDFQLTVNKLPPNMAQDELSPPVNWNIGVGYSCSQPVRVSPSEMTPGSLHSASAVASWQVVCNQTAETSTSAKCCVSFSAFYNNSVVPCPKCSCGCTPPVFPWNNESCNPFIDALLLPSQALVLPPSNRTTYAQALASQDKYMIPGPGHMPCPDNCGININWHIYSDYVKGWSARMTILNWDTQPVVNWSAAIQMPIAMSGFQDVYSFNGTIVPQYNGNELNNTLFMQGHNGYDNFYLLGRNSDGIHPGNLQSMLSFSKSKTPSMNVPGGDGYPTKVWFNGEECQVPEMRPGGDGWRLVPTSQFALVFAVTIFLIAGETWKLF